jgi:hypothetical protein
VEAIKATLTEDLDEYQNKLSQDLLDVVLSKDSQFLIKDPVAIYDLFNKVHNWKMKNTGDVDVLSQQFGKWKSIHKIQQMDLDAISLLKVFEANVDSYQLVRRRMSTQRSIAAHIRVVLRPLEPNFLSKIEGFLGSNSEFHRVLKTAEILKSLEVRSALGFSTWSIEVFDLFQSLNNLMAKFTSAPAATKNGDHSYSINRTSEILYSQQWRAWTKSNSRRILDFTRAGDIKSSALDNFMASSNLAFSSAKDYSQSIQTFLQSTEELVNGFEEIMDPLDKSQLEHLSTPAFAEIKLSATDDMAPGVEKLHFIGTLLTRSDVFWGPNWKAELRDWIMDIMESYPRTQSFDATIQLYHDKIELSFSHSRCNSIQPLLSELSRYLESFAETIRKLQSTGPNVTNTRSSIAKSSPIDQKYA